MGTVADKLIQRLIETDDPDARERLGDLLGREYEARVQRVAGLRMVTELEAALGTADQFDETRKQLRHAFEQIDNTNGAIIAIGGLLKQLQEGQAEGIAASREGAAEIKKALGERLVQLESDTAALKQGQKVFTDRLEELDQRHGQQWRQVVQDVQDIRERLEQDEQEIKGRLDRKREELDQLQAFISYLRGRMLSDEDQANLFAEFEQVKRDVETLKQRHDSA